MKIKQVKVAGLSGRVSDTYNMHDDINVITGVNGSGKTTLLKLVWYLISGNVERVAPEITFDSVALVTDVFRLSLQREAEIINWQYEDHHQSRRGTYDIANDHSPSGGSEEINQLTVPHKTQSLYFPTFRRIEGGYSMGSTSRTRRREDDEIYRALHSRNSIENDLEELARRLSVREHKFICSISTNDIISLLTSRYARTSENLNHEYTEFSASILGKIQTLKSRGQERAESDSLRILDEIQTRADAINDMRERQLKPFEVLSELTAKLFRHKGIRVQAVTLGESVDAIDSVILSAGEKQLLSFLCYNAFCSNGIIFIDEPELSLHPDWQRRLFSILIKQQPSNQFIVATHSPFIYSKYEDKELVVEENKGE